VTGAPFDRADQFGEVDIDLLADYAGGALTGTPEESAVAARIADDPVWQSAYESLGEGMTFVTAELGRLAPEPMPGDLAARLDSLLTGPAGSGLADSVADHTISAGALLNGPADQDQDAEGPVTGDEFAGPEPTAPDLVAPPEPHLTLVRGGLAAGDRARDDDAAGGDGAHGVQETQPARRRGRRLRWAAPIAVAAGVVAFVGFGLDYLAGRSTSSESTDSAAGVSADRGDVKAPQVAGAEPTLTSGIDYTHATLGIAPMRPMTAPLTSSTPGRKTAPEFASGVEPALQRLTVPASLAECLAAIEQANAAGGFSVQSVDYARFAGAPAVIVRFTAANGQWAWASGADCGTQAAGAATLDKVPVG
jgi:hypothetical protein